MELCDTLQDAYGSEYAPKTFVCYGDFRQIPPVVPAGSRGAIVDMSVRRSRTWNAFSVFHLSILHRQAQDPAYGQWVNEIGAGTLPAPHAVAGVLAFAELSLCDTVFTEKEAIDFAFPHLADAGHSATRRILTATNAMVDEFNEAILRTLATTYQMPFFSQVQQRFPGHGRPREFTIAGFCKVRPRPKPTTELHHTTYTWWWAPSTN